MSVLLRPAAEADLDEIGAVHHRSRHAAYAGLVPDAALAAGSPGAMARWWTERWRYEAETHRLSVAEADGRVLGFTYAGPTHTAGVAELYAIHVEPGRQGLGIGRALMTAALADLASVGGAERAVLWVLPGNVRARRFYEQGGWRLDGARRRAPIGPERVPQLRYGRDLPSTTGTDVGGST